MWEVFLEMWECWSVLCGVWIAKKSNKNGRVSKQVSASKQEARSGRAGSRRAGRLLAEGVSLHLIGCRRSARCNRAQRLSPRSSCRHPRRKNQRRNEENRRAQGSWHTSRDHDIFTALSFAHTILFCSLFPRNKRQPVGLFVCLLAWLLACLLARLFVAHQQRKTKT